MSLLSRLRGNVKHLVLWLLIPLLGLFLFIGVSFSVNELQEHDYNKLFKEGVVLKGRIVGFEPFSSSVTTHMDLKNFGLGESLSRQSEQGVQATISFIDPAGKERTLTEIWGTSVGPLETQLKAKPIDIYYRGKNVLVKASSKYNIRFTRKQFVLGTV